MQTNRSDVWQAVKFTLFSLTAGVLQIGLFELLFRAVSLPYWPSYLIALVASVVYNFTVNRRYTFQSVENIPRAFIKIALYYAVFTPVTTLAGEWLEKDIGVLAEIVLVGSMVLNLITEFAVCRFIVYRNTMYTNALALKKGKPE